MDLVKRLEEYRDRERDLQWEGTFAQYFEFATKKPEVGRLSHERIYHMIMDARLRKHPHRRADTITSSARKSSASRSPCNKSSNTSTPPPSAWRCANASCC